MTTAYLNDLTDNRTKSMRTGDKYKTNRMFRRRIYAQGFTVLAMLVGSIYWESDRNKRKEYNGLTKEKEQKEKYEAWLRELEVRAEEEEELKRMRKKIVDAQAAERRKGLESGKGGAEPNVDRTPGSFESVKCVSEPGDVNEGPIMLELRRLWHRRR